MRLSMRGVAALCSLAAVACSSSSDPAAATSDAGPGDPPADGGLAPIVAPPDTWTWVDFPDSRCGNGTPTGIGINPHPGATRLLLYLQGGGECTDGPSCWTSATASNIASGYGKNDFLTDPTLLLSPFSRNAGYPFADANMVFVPYCTGDVHTGTTIANYTVDGAPKPTYHYGGKNLDLFLKTLAVTFTGLDRVWFLGVSAGGFGSFLNQDFVVRAFDGIRVDVIDDSGPAIDNKVLGVPTQWAPQIPPACTTCFTASSIFAFDRKTYPETRYGLLTYQTDTELPMYYQVTPQAFSQQISTFITSLKPDPNAKAFMALSSGHVVLLETDPKASPYINPWLVKLAGDDPAWADEQH
jgi:hypothetical protein